MIFDVSSAAAALMLDGLLAALNGGSSAARAKCYTGPKPLSGAAITTETLLANIGLQDPAATVSGRTLTILPSPASTVIADGTIGWVRFEDSGGAWIADADAGTIDGTINPTAAVKFASLGIFSGGLVAIAGGTVTIPLIDI